MKEALLALLYTQNEYLPVKTIAEMLQSSDSAEGHGYRIADKCPFLSAEAVQKHLSAEAVQKHLSAEAVQKHLSAEAVQKHLSEKYCITVLPETDSTNRQLMRMADGGADEGTIVIAEKQNAGRGRLGRQFLSPPDCGIYMSILLRPTVPTAETVQITTGAAVAVAEAIETLTGEQTGIKWVNDIYMRGKKVCGILTEGAVDAASGTLRYAVLGIGINVCPPQDGFPPELASIAGTVLEKPMPALRNVLAALVIENFFREYRNWSNGVNSRMAAESCYQRYKRRMFLIGKPVTVLSCSGLSENGTCMDLDDAYRLIVCMDDPCDAGTVPPKIRAISSGEVSVRERT